MKKKYIVRLSEQERQTCSPLAGFRQATAREPRTKVDCALEAAHPLDTRYADVDLVTLVSDDLNTH